MTWLKRCVWIIIGGGAALLIWQEWRTQRESELHETPSSFVIETPAPAAAQITIMELGTDHPNLRVCEEKRCRPLAAPALDEATSLTAGSTAWYYYTAEHALMRQEGATGEAHLIMEATPLTRPRDIIMSPSGTTFAFFLDNIADPKLQLTEIWLYDATTQNVRVVAEKLYQPDIRSSIVWNSAGTRLSFVANNAPRESAEEKLELVIVNAEETGMYVAFSELEWGNVLAEEKTLTDLSLTGERLARATPKGQGAELMTLRDKGAASTLTVRGRVPYLTWLPDDSLIYIVQNETSFTLWRQRSGTHQFVAHQPGVVRAAARDRAGAYIAFAVAATEDSKVVELTAVDIAKGTVARAGALSSASHRLAIVDVQTKEAPSRVAGVTTTLEDDELVAFIERHRSAITGEAAARLTRLVVTDAVNTLFVDYLSSSDEEKRVLVTVHDALHTEWSIKGRYQAVRGQWQPAAGETHPSGQEVKAKRLYEWEDALKQWVLKASY